MESGDQDDPHNGSGPPYGTVQPGEQTNVTHRCFHVAAHIRSNIFVKERSS